MAASCFVLSLTDTNKGLQAMFFVFFGASAEQSLLMCTLLSLENILQCRNKQMQNKQQKQIFLTSSQRLNSLVGLKIFRYSAQH